MASVQTISFHVNGRPLAIDVDPDSSLLAVLREDLDLTGTKQACDCEGECGACTVLLDGEAVRSCLLPVGKAAGRHVTTVEGLGSADHLHPLQQAFVDYGAVQCGFCTPGMLMSAAALLHRFPDPTQDQILEAMAGCLCRCTGYSKIIEAIQAAAATMSGQPLLPPRQPLIAGQTVERPIIGGSQIRLDAIEKVTGAARFAEDIKMAGLVHAAVARSNLPHARVLHVDPAPALAIPGVLRVLTAADIRGTNELTGYSHDEHVLAGPGDSLRMHGDAVALVIGQTLAVARAGAAAVRIEAEPLAHTFDAREALRPDFPPIHAGGNVLSSYEVCFGELDAALASSDQILETQYETVFLEHSALERETVLSYVDADGVVTVVSGNQEPHWAQGFIAHVLGTPAEGVRVITPPTGGAFGGKQDPWPLIAGALCANQMHRPVRLAYSRHESFQASPKRHPYHMGFRLGARSDGTLLGLHLTITANTGAYDSAGRHIPQYAVVAGGGPYHWSAVQGYARTVYTNGPKAGQMRGFGTPQSIYGLECTLDELAERLKLDPLELRLRNSLDEEKVTFLGYPVAETFAYRECLEEIRPHYRAALVHAEEHNQNKSEWRHGVGIAGMWYRFGKSGPITCEAHAELETDGRLAIFFSAPDYGQGTTTIMAQLAAEAFGLPRDGLRVVNADTALTPDSGIQGASRSTYWVGGAVIRAAEALKASILGTAAEILDRHPDTLSLTVGGVMTRDGNQLSLREVAAEMDRSGLPRKVQGLFAPAPTLPPEPPEYLPFFVSGVHLAEVVVNLVSGEVVVARCLAVHDIGRAINPQSIQGQIEGSIVMGLGAALLEEYIPGASTGFSDYLMPTARSMPEIQVILLEKPGRWGPFGAKGLGEAAILASTPAMINGIYRASGARLRKLPATPERVLAAIKGDVSRPTFMLT